MDDIVHEERLTAEVALKWMKASEAHLRASFLTRIKCRLFGDQVFEIHGCCLFHGYQYKGTLYMKTMEDWDK